ncbi:MAG: hypothetical protein OEY50_05695, partial [Nitrospinota bacterium]|nr:hypothetical protein [Nitrospinota bacterium]
MRITIRPWRHQEKCPQCGVKFNSELFCDEHPWMKPERVYFDLGFTGAERAYINEDLDGDPLSLEKAKRMRDRIIQDAELCHNDVDARRLIMRNYVPRDRKKARFGAVVEKYIEWMEKRVELGKMARTTLKN